MRREVEGAWAGRARVREAVRAVSRILTPPSQGRGRAVQEGAGAGGSPAARRAELWASRPHLWSSSRDHLGRNYEGSPLLVQT